jgi:hypothetical protein
MDQANNLVEGVRLQEPNVSLRVLDKDPNQYPLSRLVRRHFIRETFHSLDQPDHQRADQEHLPARLEDSTHQSRNPLRLSPPDLKA